MLHGVLGEIVCEYSDLTLLQNLIAACDGEIRDTEYTDKITITLVLKDEFCSDFKDKLRETFCARLEMAEKEHILLPFLKK
jgi:putative IMPACT (imprinted ancient) family translation regulator